MNKEDYIWAGFYRENYGLIGGFDKNDMKAAVRVKDITKETYASIVGEPYPEMATATPETVTATPKTVTETPETAQVVAPTV